MKLRAIVEKTIKEMSVAFFWGFPWRSRPPDALQAVRMGHVGGMILQRRNDVIDSYRHIALSTERLVKDFYHLAHLIL